MAIELRDSWKKEGSGLYKLPPETFFDKAPIDKDMLVGAFEYLEKYQAAVIRSAGDIMATDKPDRTTLFLADYPAEIRGWKQTSVATTVDEDNTRQNYTGSFYESDVVDEAFNAYQKVVDNL